MVMFAVIPAVTSKEQYFKLTQLLSLLHYRDTT